MHYYHVHDLEFWDYKFKMTPMLMFFVGIVTFISCLYGFLISNMENRITLIVLAVLLSCIFFLQVGSVYFSMELKFVFTSETSGGKGVDEIRLYDEVGFDWVKPKWDRIQSQLRCCGASESMNTGYQDYSGADAFQNTQGYQSSGQKGVPDSCCKEIEDGCGRGVFELASDVDPKFYKDGCLFVLRELFQNEVATIMTVYMALGLILALIELVVVALTCAYVAQISRRLRAQDQYSRPADANGDEYMPSLKTRESTF